MKKQFVLGLIGGVLGILTALYVIVTATRNDVLLSGVQGALFSCLGLMGAAIASKDTRFAGWMLMFSAIFIALSVPIAGSLNLLYMYLPAIIVLAAAGILCFMEKPDVGEEDGGEETRA
jgi:hypothetical protein